jgi:hypothetical protein
MEQMEGANCMQGERRPEHEKVPISCMSSRPWGRNGVGAFRQRACQISQKAVRWHPDKNPDKKEYAQKRMQRINEAYETLSDIEKRKMYDLGEGMTFTVSSHATYFAFESDQMVFVCTADPFSWVIAAYLHWFSIAGQLPRLPNGKTRNCYAQGKGKDKGDSRVVSIEGTGPFRAMDLAWISMTFLAI